jgi:hypothetical protein
MVMRAYDEASGKGDRNSVAVRDTVDLVKQCNLKMPISQTEVKRALATWRPRDCQTMYLFKRSSLTEEDSKLNRLIREQLATLQGEERLEIGSAPHS